MWTSAAFQNEAAWSPPSTDRCTTHQFSSVTLIFIAKHLSIPPLDPTTVFHTFRHQMKAFNPANDHILASQAFGHCRYRGSEERSAPTAGWVCLGLLKVTRPRKGRAERRTREKYANQEKEKKQPTNQQASEQKRLTATTNELTRDAGASRYRFNPRSTSRSVRWSSPITKGVYRASFQSIELKLEINNISFHYLLKKI